MKTRKRKDANPNSLYSRYHKMDLTERKAFRAFCKQHFQVTTKTLYNWIRGDYSPGAVEQLVIASFLKTIPSDIWGPITNVIR